MKFWLALVTAIVAVASISATALAMVGLPYAPLSDHSDSHRPYGPPVHPDHPGNPDDGDHPGDHDGPPSDLPHYPGDPRPPYGPHNKPPENPPLGSCPDVIRGDRAGASIDRVNYEMQLDNSLLFNFDVRMRRPARVWVRYHQAGLEGEFLNTGQSEDLAWRHSFPVLRLRANSDYCFQVFAVDRDGKVSDSVPGALRTGELPVGLASATFDLAEGQPTFPVVLLEHNTPDFSGIVGLDSAAQVVWYYQREAGRAGTLVQDSATSNILFEATVAGESRWTREITPLGEIVQDSPDICLYPVDPLDPAVRGGGHHEILVPVNDQVLYLGRVVRDPFGDSDRYQMGDTIRRWNRETGEDVEVWDPFDFLDPINDRTPRSSVKTFEPERILCAATPNEDWTHANSLQVAPDGNVVMSIRHLNQIVAIDPDFESLAWRLGDAGQLGDPTSDFSFPEPADRFYHQHSARQLPNGNILLFDNGNTRPVSEGGEYSRALELELDFDTMEARKVWEYRNDPSLFAACCSNVTRLDNGNTVIIFGSNFQLGECCRTFTLVEADDEGNVVAKMEIKAAGKNIQYRVYPVDSIFGESDQEPLIEDHDSRDESESHHPSRGDSGDTDDDDSNEDGESRDETDRSRARNESSRRR